AMDLQGLAPERGGERVVVGHGLGPARGQIEREAVAIAAHEEWAAAGMEADLAGAGREPVHPDEAGGERGMAAQIDLAGRGEPAQLVIPSRGDEEGGLRQVVLGRDRLHRLVREPGRKRAYPRRIAREEAIGEGVDLEE